MHRYYDQLVKEQNFEPLNLEVRKINDEMSLWVLNAYEWYIIPNDCMWRMEHDACVYMFIFSHVDIYKK